MLMSKVKTAVVTVIAAALIAVPSITLVATNAYAAPQKSGNGILTAKGSWLGAYQNRHSEDLMWCIQLGLPAIDNEHTITSQSVSHTQKIEGVPDDERALYAREMSYIFENYEHLNTKVSRAAISYIAHVSFEWGTTSYSTYGATPKERVAIFREEIRQNHPEVLDQAKAYIKAARANTIHGFKEPIVSGDNMEKGAINDIGVLNGKNMIPGTKYTITLSGPVEFTNGSKTISSTTADKAKTHNWVATGNGKASYKIVYTNPHPKNVIVNRETKNGGVGIQDMISRSREYDTFEHSESWNTLIDFQPMLKSKVVKKTIDKGTEISDKIETFADPDYVNPKWPKVNGEYIPVKFVGKAYFLGEGIPPKTSKNVPAGAKPIATTSFVSNGPQTHVAKLPKAGTKPGFYTWVWDVKKSDQGKYSSYIAKDWNHSYALAEETQSIRKPIEINSEMTVRVTKGGTYLIDDLFVENFQDDHTKMPATLGFKADNKSFKHTLFFFPDGLEVTEKNKSKAEKICSFTLDATNKFHASLGSTKCKAITDGKNMKKGTYVYVTEFSGDDRTLPMITPVTDKNEQFVVDESVKVRTKATNEIMVGEQGFDTAFVSGNVAKDSQLSFELYKAQDGEDKPQCSPDNKVFEQKEALVINEPGEYVSEKYTFTQPGTYYWVETLRNDEGQVLHRGECGLPDETTKVKGPKVTTKAQPEIVIGEPATDTAIVEGDLPKDGAQLTFEAYKAVNKDGEKAVCDDDNKVFTSEKAIDVTKTGEYVSEEAFFTEVGDYYWIETLKTKDGKTIHRGECGLPNETTKVKPGPKVTTKATEEVVLGQPATDTAIVEGDVPENGVELMFEAYKKINKDGQEPVCDDDNKVFTSSKTIEVTKAGEYVSEEVVFDEVGDYYWVESLTTKDGKEIHRGECGLPNETTKVTQPDEPTPPAPSITPLAKTGAGIIGGLSLAAIFVLVGSTLIRRRTMLN